MVARSSPSSTGWARRMRVASSGVGRLSFTWKSAVTVQGGAGGVLAAHQGEGRRPVAVAIEQRPDDATVDDAVEGQVVRRRPKFRDQLVSIPSSWGRHEAAQAEPLLIGRAAPKAAVVGRVSLLHADVGGGASWRSRLAASPSDRIGWWCAESSTARALVWDWPPLCCWPTVLAGWAHHRAIRRELAADAESRRVGGAAYAGRRGLRRLRRVRRLSLRASRFVATHLSPHHDPGGVVGPPRGGGG